MNDLRHYGILGMKWGIHRRGPASSEHIKTGELKKKHVSELTNDELKTAIGRMQLEKQFKELSAASVGKGRGILTKMLVTIGTQAVNSYVSSKNPDQSSYEFFAQAVREKVGKKKD